jgi:hypothetical protein
MLCIFTEATVISSLTGSSNLAMMMDLLAM